MLELSALFLLFIGSYLLTVLARIIALRHHWFDVPNSRSLHKAPTPKSGGLGFIMMFSAAAALLFSRGLLDGYETAALLMGLPVAVAGLVDDIINLNVTVRITVHFASTAAVMLLVGGLPMLPVFDLAVDFGWLGYIIGVLGLIWLINLYNFMDGIDGVAGLQALFVCLAAAWLAWQRGGGTDACVLLVLAVSVAGFLPLNLPPARIFMGDTGSNYLGLTLGVLGLLTIHHGSMHIWSWAILMGVFIVDSTHTLAMRIRAGEVWYYAHRSHAYQQAARRLASHGKVDLSITVINLLWLFPLAWFSLEYTRWAMVATIIAYTPLVMLGVMFKAGTKTAGSI